MQCALFYIKHTEVFTSPKQNLLVFQVKTKVKALRPTSSWYHNFRQLQHYSSSREAVLLTCLEDIAQNYPSYCFYYIHEIRTIVLLLPL